VFIPRDRIREGERILIEQNSAPRPRLAPVTKAVQPWISMLSCGSVKQVSARSEAEGPGLRRRMLALKQVTHWLLGNSLAHVYDEA